MKIMIVMGMLFMAGCSAYSQPVPYRSHQEGPNIYCSMDPPNQPGCK
jgi:PBP1b-binding outer membrane lipoprotein LpoB